MTSVSGTPAELLSLALVAQAASRLVERDAEIERRSRHVNRIGFLQLSVIIGLPENSNCQVWRDWRDWATPENLASDPKAKEVTF